MAEGSLAELEEQGGLANRAVPHCPGRKPPKSVAKRPARPYKNTIESLFTVENAKGAQTPPGPARTEQDLHKHIVVPAHHCLPSPGR
jgi:hypothetical protein